MSESIAPISAIGASTGAVVTTASFRFAGENAVRAASRLFNMNEEDVSRMLSRGDSLQDMAAARNINRGELISAIRQAFRSDGSHLNYQTSAQLAQAIVSQRGKAPLERREGDADPHGQRRQRQTG